MPSGTLPLPPPTPAPNARWISASEGATTLAVPVTLTHRTAFPARSAASTQTRGSRSMFRTLALLRYVVNVSPDEPHATVRMG